MSNDEKNLTEPKNNIYYYILHTKRIQRASRNILHLMIFVSLATMMLYDVHKDDMLMDILHEKLNFPIKSFEEFIKIYT